jgi:hypothetical protein
MNKTERERYEIALYRYKRRFPGLVLNICAPFLCLSALAWFIPPVGRSLWTQHPGHASACIWLVLVVIGFVWQLCALVAAGQYIIDFVRLVCSRPMDQTQERQRAVCPKGKVRKCRLSSPIHAKTSRLCPAIGEVVGPKKFRSYAS